MTDEPKPLDPPRYRFRPSLTYRIGSWLYNMLRNRG